MPVLQVALDLLDLEKAVKIAGLAVRGGADWIEAGTPLIKAEGIRCVRILSEHFPGRTIVADMKAMDVGALEVEMAAEQGAKVVTVMGAAPDETILSAAEKAKELGVSLMVDMLGVKEYVERAKEAQEMGANIVCVHRGIDQQAKGPLDFSFVRNLKKELKIKVAVAGGIKAETAPLAVKAGADIIIVGGAITKAEDPEKAAREIREAMDRA